MGQVLELKQVAPPTTTKRKGGCNHNKKGSVRDRNGKIYIDFMYLGERVRENTGVKWNDKNVKNVRKQLDRIMIGIENGSLRFAKVFPHSNKKEFFTKKERLLFNEKPPPGEIKIGEYIWKWYNTIRGSGRRSGRTLLSYKGYINNYLVPYFGEMTFDELNAMVLEHYISWCKQRQYRKKTICNKTVNKTLVPMKMMCRDAAVEFGWGSAYNPFFGFKKLREDDSTYEIIPFSKAEQEKFIKVLSDHWKPYFKFAFCAGLRPGEQIAIKPGDIDWKKKQLHIRRAMTLDENGKLVEGRTKNKYSRRTINLIPAMYDCLVEQKSIYDNFNGTYFFCSNEGGQVDFAHLRQRVWIPGLKKAGIPMRELKQTRHSFATLAMSCGENPLWIAKVMGHANVDMIIKVYSKYVENAVDDNDGMAFSTLQQRKGNDG